MASYRLLGPDGTTYSSNTPGTFGGNQQARIYGRLDCPAALSALKRADYAKVRVFFADESAAIAAGYRPCGRCLRAAYQTWKGAQS
jgi:methylphosphotriester-DNA--protein-cysteine methyltransferase